MDRAGHELAQGLVDELVLLDARLALELARDDDRLVMVLCRSVLHLDLDSAGERGLEPLFEHLGFDHGFRSWAV